jgi:hypothetical protein
MAEAVVRTVHRDGLWINEIHEGDPIDAGFLSKDDAVDAGRRAAEARGAEHVVEDG